MRPLSSQLRRVSLPVIDEIQAARAKRHLESWCRLVDSSYQTPSHINKLIEALEALERRDIKRLIVSMPPRHGKSITTTIRFPAWFLGRNPDSRVICASHTASLAYSFSRRCRNEFSEFGQAVFGVELAGDSAAVNRWDIATHRGGLLAAGVGGPITGAGADCLICDDPIKDSESANSSTQRKAILEWWQTVARPRLHPGGVAILVMTRWNEADLAGELLSQKEGERWEQLSFPMVDDAGRILWPGRYSEEEVSDIRRAVGSRAWESIYQQRPMPAEGGILKHGWWRFFDVAPECETYIQSWDMTFKGTGDSDYVVGQVWGKNGADFYLLDQRRGKWDFSETCRQLNAFSAKWPNATLKLVEDKANGPAIISHLKSKVEGLVAVEPNGSKEARVAAVTPLIEAGNVHLPNKTNNPWVEELILEATSFPNGRHDDQIDAMSQALNRLKLSTNYVPKIKRRSDSLSAHQ